MEPHVAQVTDCLMNHMDSQLVIRKEEQGDVDQVFMTLKKVSFIPGDPRRDDYVEEDRIVLHGDGCIATEGHGGAAELPRHSYEIPLQSGFRTTPDRNGLTVHTGRATYKFMPQ